MYVCITDISLVMALPCMSDEESKSAQQKLSFTQQLNLRKSIGYKLIYGGATLEQIVPLLDKLTIVEVVQGLLNGLITSVKDNHIDSGIIKAVIERLVNCKEEYTGTSRKFEIIPATNKTKINALSYALLIAFNVGKSEIITFLIQKGANTNYLNNENFKRYFFQINGSCEILKIPEINKAAAGYIRQSIDNFVHFAFSTGLGNHKYYISLLEASKFCGVNLDEHSFRGTTVSKLLKDYYKKQEQKPKVNRK